METGTDVNDDGTPALTAAQVAALQADPFNGGVPMTGGEYLQTTMAVIAAAQFIDNQGILAVRTTFPNLDACYATVTKMVVSTGYNEARHAISSDASVAPSAIVPYSPPNLTGGIITMPSSSLIVGTTHTATFTANGPLYGTPAWTITPSTAATLTPAAPSASTPDVATCGVAFLAAGAFTLSCVGQADPTVGVNPITASLAGTVILQEATSATLTLV